MKRICLVAAAATLTGIVAAAGQDTPPEGTDQIADFTVYAGAAPRSIDVATAYPDAGVTDAVRMTTVAGNIDIELFGRDKPITVTNFLKYVDQGRYFIDDPTTHQLASSFIHRSQPNFVIQGGGFLGTVNSQNTAIQPTQVLTFPAIQNEPGISNQRGTIAMAKIGNDPNSATSQWFINLADNGGPPTNLDTQNGGFTVFGRVVGNGMTVADSIAGLPRYNFSAADPNFSSLPLRNYNGTSAVQVANLVSIPAITHIVPLTAMSDNGNVSVAVSGSKVLVSGVTVGTSHVTVTTTDLDGGTNSQMFTVTVVAAPGRPVNLSTRMQVGTGDNALIAGFIMRGSAAKRLVIRALGPSTGLGGAIANPTLELHDATGATIATNDNWGDAANKQDVIDFGFAPSSPNESVILTTVPSDPSAAIYTAVMRGANNTTGLGVVEVYDIDSGPGSTLLNIATRGQVGTDPNALIGGFIMGGTEPKQILVRATGPSLTAFGVPNALADPILELRDMNGALIDSNDNWMDSPQKPQIQASGLAPSDLKESAVLRTLAAGAYTAIVHGVSNGTGVGTVQIYQLN
ncbi:MAG TPA: peptidylprolyl isomerase [Chthoniobacterales bacterium]|nr:peptidylprolyl isomerase [Chthoniobacterales bacterium]